MYFIALTTSHRMLVHILTLKIFPCMWKNKDIFWQFLDPFKTLFSTLIGQILHLSNICCMQSFELLHDFNEGNFRVCNCCQHVVESQWGYTCWIRSAKAWKKFSGVSTKEWIFPFQMAEQFFPRIGQLCWIEEFCKYKF